MSCLVDSALKRLASGRNRLTTIALYLTCPRAWYGWWHRRQGEIARSKAGNLFPAVTLSFDVDYPEDVYALENLCNFLKEKKLRASFALVGAWVEKYPEFHQRLVTEGHEILNHTQNHPDNEILAPGRRFDELNDRERRAEIEQAGRVIMDTLGVATVGFRAPHFGNVRGRAFYKDLIELGYRFSSSVTAPDSPEYGLPFTVEDKIREIPVSCSPDRPFTVLDTWNCLRNKNSRFTGAGKYVQLVEEALTVVIKTGSYLNLYIDPRDFADYPEVARAIELIAEARDCGKIRSVPVYSELIENLT